MEKDPASTRLEKTRVLNALQYVAEVLKPSRFGAEGVEGTGPSKSMVIKFYGYYKYCSSGAQGMLWP